MEMLLKYLPIIMQLVGEIPAIRAAFEGNVNGLSAVKDVLHKTNLATDLADLGAKLYPKLDPAFHSAAAALALVHPNSTAWVQSALNVLADAGVYKMTGRLKVDGKAGNRTKAAIGGLQAQLGFPVTGFLLDAEYNALTVLLAKI